MSSRREKATLGGGCFWCLDAVFRDLRGVEGVESGYAGGQVEDPTYEQVCTGGTGHAEVVQVTFDPDRISYEEVLGVFFSIHDPTQFHRQGADVGSQYRSAVFYHSPEQKVAAEAFRSRLELEKVWDAPIVTEIAPLEAFYPAEEYHQDYFRRNPNQGYCQVVVAPKVAEFRAKYTNRLRDR